MSLWIYLIYQFQFPDWRGSWPIYVPPHSTNLSFITAAEYLAQTLINSIKIGQIFQKTELQLYSGVHLAQHCQMEERGCVTLLWAVQPHVKNGVHTWVPQ